MPPSTAAVSTGHLEADADVAAAVRQARREEEPPSAVSTPLTT